MEDLLPLGSVVLLKGGTKRIMICGRMQERVEDGIHFDYCACYYPEGILEPERLFLFNHEDIATIEFRGFENEEEKRFQVYIRDYRKADAID